LTVSTLSTTKDACHSFWAAALLLDFFGFLLFLSVIVVFFLLFLFRLFRF
jgi:hypothetical protein